MAARAPKPPAQTATARTISLFTGKTDLEDVNARDGSPPDPVSDYNEIRLRPRHKWKRYQLTQYSCEALNALILVERDGIKGDGAWVYRVIRAGVAVGTFGNICAAADAAEAA
jgi:hypothetical protein